MIYFEYFLYPFILSIIISFFLMISNLDPINNNLQNKNMAAKSQQKNKFKKMIKSDYFQSFIIIGIFKNIIYYEQSINQILSTSSLAVLFKSFTSIFNLSIISYDNNTNPWCFINGLTAKYKILIDLLIPIILLLLYHLLI